MARCLHVCGRSQVDTRDTRDVEETRNALGVPSEQVLVRAPRPMDTVRVRVPVDSRSPDGKQRTVDGIVLGSADGGARLKVRHCCRIA